MHGRPQWRCGRNIVRCAGEWQGDRQDDGSDQCSHESLERLR
jgi:hypothetical protein